MRTIHFFSHFSSGKISSLMINGEIIQEREVESSGHVLQEVVCRMRYWEGNFEEARMIIFGLDFPVEAHSGVCDEMLWQGSSNYYLFGCISSGICKR